MHKILLMNLNKIVQYLVCTRMKKSRIAKLVPRIHAIQQVQRDKNKQ